MCVKKKNRLNFSIKIKNKKQCAAQHNRVLEQFKQLGQFEQPGEYERPHEEIY